MSRASIDFATFFHRSQARLNLTVPRLLRFFAKKWRGWNSPCLDYSAFGDEKRRSRISPCFDNCDFLTQKKEPSKCDSYITIRTRGPGTLAPRERPLEPIVEENLGCSCLCKAPLLRKTRVTRFPGLDWISLTGRIIRG